MAKDGVAPDKPLSSAVLTRLKQFSAMNKLKKMALRVGGWLTEWVHGTWVCDILPFGWEGWGPYCGDASQRSSLSLPHLSPPPLSLSLKHTHTHTLPLLLLLQPLSTSHPFSPSFFQVIAESLSEEEITGLKEAFKMMDVDGSGTITFEELKAGLKRIGSNLNDMEIKELMDAVSQREGGGEGSIGEAD